MFYTYAHLKPCGTIFYIGKGSLKRAHAKDNRNKHWKNIVAKYGYSVKILAPWKQEKEALEHEKFLIKVFKDLGYSLVNYTEGGEGVSGYKHTKDTKLKMSAFQKEFQKSEKMKKVKEINNKNYRENIVRRQEQSRKIKEFMSLPENRQRAKEAAILQNSNMEFKETQREKAKKRMQDDKYRYLTALSCVCVETGEVFKSRADAARWVGNGAKGSKICQAIKGDRKSAYGFHWKNVVQE